MFPHPRFGFAMLVLTFGLLARVSPAPADVVTVAAVGPAPASMPAASPPAPPGHCADYEAMEAHRGHPANQRWFDRLDPRGYARLRAACVYHWGTAEWSCLEQLWDEESSWSPTAGHVASSYGIPQSYPGRKMASAGADWRTNPRTQIRWGLAYIADRPGYGRPSEASLYQPKRRCHAGY